jgi:hypothetical protein
MPEIGWLSFRRQTQKTATDEQSYSDPGLFSSSTSAGFELQRLRKGEAAFGAGGPDFETERGGAAVFGAEHGEV